MLTFEIKPYRTPDNPDSEWVTELYVGKVGLPEDFNEVPNPPFGLIIDAEVKLPEWEKWEKLMRKWQLAGAVWFAGSGRDGASLEGIFDWASIQSKEFEDEQDKEWGRGRLSICSPSLGKAIEDSHLIGRDHVTNPKGDALYRHVVLTETGML